jgi:hypothetical protein
MKRTTERALWIGGSAAAAAGLVTGIVLLTRKSSTAAPAAPVVPAGGAITSTGPSGTTIPVAYPQSVLTQGHRYWMILTCTSETARPALASGAQATVIVTTPVGPLLISGGTSKARGWKVEFLYTGPTTPAAVDASTLFGPTPATCASTLTDLGPPANINAIQGPSATPPAAPATSGQSVSVQAAGVYHASATAGGALTIATPGSGVSIDPSPAVTTWTSVAPHSAVVVTLSGASGVIYVRWSNPTPPNSASAQINIS